MSALDLDAVADQVPLLDEDARARASARQDRLTKPLGALGRIEELGSWLAAVQGACPTRALERVRVVVFAGDHGIARAGVSAYPPEVTAQMVANFAAGGAAVNVLARQVGATVRIVDMSVDADLGASAEVGRWKVRRSSGSIDREDAMSRAEAEQAFRAGMEIADLEVDAGADLLVVGDMGIGNTTPSAVLVAALTDNETVAVVGRGTGVDDAGWTRKAAAVRDALRRARPVLGDPIGLLATVGGADLAAMSGFLLQAAVRRTPVLLDGVVVAAAALVAQQVSYRAPRWWAAGHRSTEPAHPLALTQLDLTPLLDLGLRLGEGTGALLAVPLLRSAAAVLSEMATFDEAGVSDRADP